MKKYLFILFIIFYSCSPLLYNDPNFGQTYNNVSNIRMDLYGISWESDIPIPISQKKVNTKNINLKDTIMAENTWPVWNRPIAKTRRMDMHSWKPIEGKYKTDQCTKCGIVRRYDPNTGMTAYYSDWINDAPVGHLGYRAPKCKTKN